MNKKPSTKDPMVSVALRMPEELASRLHSISKRTGCPKSHYMVQAISEYISEIEDLELAKVRIQEIKDKRSRTYQLSEVETELGLST
jgi:RHH-type rel operon transcriptional repressor/antitoxin RelB